MKTKIVKALIVIFLIWVFMGGLSRISIMSLIDKHDQYAPNTTLNYDQFVFGVSLDVGEAVGYGAVVWLDDDENAEMRNHLKNAKFGCCVSSEKYFMADGGKERGFYVVPRWVDSLGLKSVLFPFMNRIEMFYWPSKQLMYLSEDVEELGYDYIRGLNVDNVKPALLQF